MNELAADGAQMGTDSADNPAGFFIRVNLCPIWGSFCLEALNFLSSWRLKLDSRKFGRPDAGADSWPP
jgi:hypothetical protein